MMVGVIFFVPFPSSVCPGADGYLIVTPDMSNSSVFNFLKTGKTEYVFLGFCWI
jgi:hypothetical protein